MHKAENIFRLFLFMVCSAAGILSITLSVLGPEWKSLYELKAAVIQTRQNNEKIEDIIEDHQILISQINADANILKRIAPLTLGTVPQESNQPVAKITQETLGKARAVLEQKPQIFDYGQVPQWLERCTSRYGRITLFTAGSGLVVVSFVCFGNRKTELRIQ